ncbi:MAG: molecular chaperone TorD family protein [Proteobacteria bacterium]|jgi:TorA maturation chaperone TorD|nr:molecular chaperone TorD family protein [Pseudomonadota bacterium]
MGDHLNVENPDFVTQDLQDTAAQQQRAGAYALLANLLSRPPTANVLTQIGLFTSGQDTSDDFGLALASLGLAVQAARAEDIEDEFHVLFIGMGRGELMPYGSWYQTGFLMEKPLSLLRDDLQRLGYARDESDCEPEDNAATLCEVMAVLITEQHSFSTQVDFFNAHLAPWLGRFFEDLQASETAVFYKTVGRLGAAFLNLEQQYLSLPA